MQKLSILAITLLTTPTYALITTKSMSYTVEERINDTTFRQQTTIANGERSALYFINSIPAEADTYEEALLNAEKEESKRKRRQAEKQRLKAYELQYRGQVRLHQSSLKKATEKLVALLRTALDTNLEQFRAYTPDTISSQEELITIAETLLPHAKQLYISAPEKTNLAHLSSTQEAVEKKTHLLRTFVTNSVNEGINNAHDTKLLKELLQLASSL